MNLFITLLLTIIVGFFYFYHQNRSVVIGGPISKQKAYWLFFALFFYYVFPTYLLLNAAFHSNLLLICFGWLVLRAGVQFFLMFSSKSWTPVWGLFFNAGLVVLAAMMILELVQNGLNYMHGRFWIFFHSTLIYISISDSYYAYQFYRIVGKGTKGKDAIWFASSSDPRFKRINTITLFNNIVASLMGTGLLIHYLYDFH